MSASVLSPPILYVADCTEMPPADALRGNIRPEIKDYLYLKSTEWRNAFLWSRLIIKTVPTQLFPTENKTMELYENFSESLHFTGDIYQYGSVSHHSNRVAVALSTLPINVAIYCFDPNFSLDKIQTQTLSSEIINWIERQKNPKVAYYQYLATQRCVQKRRNPTIKLIVNDDDSLKVIGTSVSLQETLTFWISDEWLCAVQGPALTTLMTELRTKEKTLKLLKELAK